MRVKIDMTRFTEKFSVAWRKKRNYEMLACGSQQNAMEAEALGWIETDGEDKVGSPQSGTHSRLELQTCRPTKSGTAVNHSMRDYAHVQRQRE
jgi:hypothetical protein